MSSSRCFKCGYQLSSENAVCGECGIDQSQRNNNDLNGEGEDAPANNSQVDPEEVNIYKVNALRKLLGEACADILQFSEACEQCLADLHPAWLEPGEEPPATVASVVPMLRTLAEARSTISSVIDLPEGIKLSTYKESQVFSSVHGGILPDDPDFASLNVDPIVSKLRDNAAVALFDLKVRITRVESRIRDADAAQLMRFGRPLKNAAGLMKKAATPQFPDQHIAEAQAQASAAASSAAGTRKPSPVPAPKEASVALKQLEKHAPKQTEVASTKPTEVKPAPKQAGVAAVKPIEVKPPPTHTPVAFVPPAEPERANLAVSVPDTLSPEDSAMVTSLIESMMGGFIAGTDPITSTAQSAPARPEKPAPKQPVSQAPVRPEKPTQAPSKPSKPAPKPSPKVEPASSETTQPARQSPATSDQAPKKAESAPTTAPAAPKKVESPLTTAPEAAPKKVESSPSSGGPRKVESAPTPAPEAGPQKKKSEKQEDSGSKPLSKKLSGLIGRSKKEKKEGASSSPTPSVAVALAEQGASQRIEELTMKREALREMLELESSGSEVQASLQDQLSQIDEELASLRGDLKQSEPLRGVDKNPAEVHSPPNPKARAPPPKPVGAPKPEARSPPQPKGAAPPKPTAPPKPESRPAPAQPKAVPPKPATTKPPTSEPSAAISSEKPVPAKARSATRPKPPSKRLVAKFDYQSQGRTMATGLRELAFDRDDQMEFVKRAGPGWIHVRLDRGGGIVVEGVVPENYTRPAGAASRKPPQPSATPANIPVVVSESVDWLRKYALDSRGIFRESADANQLKALKHKYAAGTGGHLVGVRDEHVVAGLLKVYYRELSPPPISREVCVALRDAGENPDLLDAALLQLSTDMYAQMKLVFGLLRDVALRCDTNLMTGTNLGVCWAPTLFRSGAQMTDVVAVLVSHYDEIFR